MIPDQASPENRTASHARPAPPAVSRALLGRSRARLLGILDEPASTTELAGRLGVTPSAVSQHLQVLAAAGLVTRARAGRAVLYQRTETGTQLTGPGNQPTGVAGQPAGDAGPGPSATR